MGATARREREREARREAILDAALQTIVAKGYEALRMEEVADAAELSKGTVYLYFENKDALCAALAGRTLETFLPELRKRLDGAPNGLQGIAALLQFYLEFTEQHPHHFRFAMAWLSASELMDDSSDEFRAYRAQIGEVLALAAQSIQRGQQDGTIRSDVDPLQQALQAWASFLGVIMLHLGRPNFEKRIPMPIDLSKVAAVHIESVLRSLKPNGVS